MTCHECGSEKMRTVLVHRGKVYRTGEWKIANADTREVLCDICGARYYTETRFSHIVRYLPQGSRRIIERLGRSFE